MTSPPLPVVMSVIQPFKTRSEATLKLVCYAGLNTQYMAMLQADKENASVNQAQQGADHTRGLKPQEPCGTAETFHMSNSLVTALLAAAENAQVGSPCWGHHEPQLCMYGNWPPCVDIDTCTICPDAY